MREGFEQARRPHRARGAARRSNKSPPLLRRQSFWRREPARRMWAEKLLWCSRGTRFRAKMTRKHRRAFPSHKQSDGNILRNLNLQSPACFSLIGHLIQFYQKPHNEPRQLPKHDNAHESRYGNETQGEELNNLVLDCKLETKRVRACNPQSPSQSPPPHLRQDGLRQVIFRSEILYGKM